MFLRKFSTFHGWHKILLWFLTIGWMSVIFGFSSQNSGQSSGISRTLLKVENNINDIDDLVFCDQEFYVSER